MAKTTCRRTPSTDPVSVGGTTGKLTLEATPSTDPVSSIFKSAPKFAGFEQVQISS